MQRFGHTMHPFANPDYTITTANDKLLDLLVWHNSRQLRIANTNFIHSSFSKII